MDQASKVTKVSGLAYIILYALSIINLIINLFQIQQNDSAIREFLNQYGAFDAYGIFSGIMYFALIISLVFLFIHIVFYRKLLKGYISKTYMIIILVISIIGLLSLLNNANNDITNDVQNSLFVIPFMNFLTPIVVLTYTISALIDKGKGTSYNKDYDSDYNRY